MKNPPVKKRDKSDVMFKSKAPRIMGLQVSDMSNLDNRKESKDCFMMTGNKQLEKEEKDEIIEQKKNKMKVIY